MENMELINVLNILEKVNKESLNCRCSECRFFASCDEYTLNNSLDFLPCQIVDFASQMINYLEK